MHTRLGRLERLRRYSGRWLALAAVGPLFAAYAPAAQAGASVANDARYRFTVVATVGAAAPGGGNFTYDFEPSAINSAGDVAFTADVTDTSGQNDIGEGTFLERGGSLTQITRVGLPAPGASTFGVGELGRLGLNDAGDAAVPFTLDGWDPSAKDSNLLVPSGVWRYARPTDRLSPVAVPGTAMPGGGTFEGTSFNVGMNQRADVVFPALVTGTQIHPAPPGTDDIALALFKQSKDGTISSVVRPGDAAPGGRVFDDAWNGSINDAGDIAFSGHLQGDTCIDIGNPYACGDSVYLRDGATGAITSVAHQGDPAPGGGTFVHAFGGVINNAGTIVFIGDLSTPPANDQVLGVFTSARGSLRSVARPGDDMPGGGAFVSAADYDATYGINNNGDVAFAAALDTDTTGTGNRDTGVYVASRGSLRLVARTGTVIPGVGTIKNLSQAPLSVQPGSGSGGLINDRGQVLLNVTLTDGHADLLVATPTN